MPEQRWTPPDLSGRVALVTGGSRGIGRGIAEVLAECGAKTYVVGRSPDEAADAIAVRGGNAVAAACDLRHDDAVDALFERVRADDGHLEILVNNAVGWGTHRDGGGTTTSTSACARTGS